MFCHIIKITLNTATVSHVTYVVVISITLLCVSVVDLLPLLVTFICCFWDIAYGIMIGIGVSLLILLLEHSMYV